jgi:hypothetical protein
MASSLAADDVHDLALVVEHDKPKQEAPVLRHLSSPLRGS